MQVSWGLACHLVLRQKPECAHSRSRFTWPHLLRRPGESHIAIICQTLHRAWVPPGHSCISQLGTVAQPGWWLTQTWRTPGYGWWGHLEGMVTPCSGSYHCHQQRWLPILSWSSSIPFQVEMSQVDFCSTHSTIWLTAISGKRNNQIIIQSWVFNSRKASGC